MNTETPLTRLRRRLGYIVEGIDAGRFRTPEDAADAIIDTVLSVYPEHRDDLMQLLKYRPVSRG